MQVEGFWAYNNFSFKGLKVRSVEIVLVFLIVYKFTKAKTKQGQRYNLGSFRLLEAAKKSPPLQCSEGS